MAKCCTLRAMRTLETIYSYEHGHSSESLKICRCKTCGQLWKIRLQWDDGSGYDDVWLKPGQDDPHKGYSFAPEEAAKYEGL